MTDTVYLVTILQIYMLLTRANSFAVKNCHEGLFLHVIPETNEGRCCIVVPIKRGEEFEICGKDGESDRVRPCPQGLYQPDNTNSASEVTCITPPQCIEGENVESEVCADGFCRKECICNVKAGKCGIFYYQCEDIPTDCPENKVHPNCSCVIKPQEAYMVGSISSEPRTVLQCRKQYDNIKQRAKEKLHDIKTPQTGGGPKPIDPPPSQQIILEQLGGRPQMCGLNACLDTEVENLEEEVEKILYSGMQGTYEPLPGPSNQSLSIDSMSNIQIPSNASSRHFIRKSNKRMKTSYTYADAEEENLKLENKKIELETIKLGKEIAKLDLEIIKLQKENEMIQKLDENLSLKKEILLLKKEILLQQATQMCLIEQ